MRIAELSRETGVPIATIKYYVREGLLPAGRATAPNQAQYGDQHVERLRLIRALREGADLSIATLVRVFDVMDRHRPHDRPAYLTLAVRALSDPVDEEVRRSPGFETAAESVAALLDDLGWDVDVDSPGRDDLIVALAAIDRHLAGLIERPEQLRPFARAVRRLADTEIADDFDVDVDPVEALRFSVLGTVLFEPVILALRKLAHVDRIREVTRTGVGDRGS